METLCFRLPGHGDTTLNHMNSLRCSQHFCDITIVASNKQTFKGHKVVLAACSPFLRDQFLLNPSPNLQVSVLYSSTVICDLLKSCYTGMLQFNSEEIVNYLTAASYLQMDVIVERCRRALKKVMELKNPNLSKASSGDNQPQSFAVGRRSDGVTCASPSAHQHSPVQPPSPHLHSADVCIQDSSLHQDGHPTLEEQYIKVSVSDDGEEMQQEDCDKLNICVANEAAQRNAEERRPPSDVPHEAFCPETEGITTGESECDLILADDDIGITRAQGKVRGKGRGFKRRRLASLQGKKPPEMDRHQDFWYLAAAGMGGTLGMDYIQEGLKGGAFMSVELPQLEKALGEGEGEKASSTSASALTHGGMEDSSSGTCEGTSGLAVNEAVDESVAVVGSTSSVSGPVICEQCGMTFPSIHASAVHSCPAHHLYSCPCCGKQFHHAASLTQHMAVHRGAAKSHQCPLCYKTFTQKSTLIDHMNLHSGERPHHCAYCHARFAHKPALRRHLKELHGKTTAQNFLFEQQEQERGSSSRGIHGGAL